MITARKNTCLIRLSWIISSELHLRCSNEEPINEDSSQGPGLLQEGIETEESGSDFGYAYRVFDNEDILLELDGSNNIVTRYTHGPGIDEPLIVEKSGQSFFYHADGLGSITELTDATGAVVKSYVYSSFGKIESETNPTFFQPYTFTAREFDPETELYHYRERTYDWRTGRFTTEDPIGIVGGINLYAAVGNNPVNFTDPTGLLFGGLVDAGENYGDYAAQYWADRLNQTGNPLYYIPGLLASLWTQCTSDQTALTLLSGGISGAAARLAASAQQATQLAKGLTLSNEAVRRMAQRGITEKMIRTALSKGEKFWDPANKVVNSVLREGFASGKDLLVGQNPVTNQITTVIRGADLIAKRFIPIP